MQQIVALGGGGFSEEPDTPLLDDFILRLTGKPRPKICFVPTASGDADSYVVRFYRAFAQRAELTHLALFNRTVDDLRAFLLPQDVIYVGGGNTANLLAVWRAHAVDHVLREASQAGTILCGISAGALCWFEAGVTDSFGPKLAALHNGLGFLPGSFCPHYESDAGRRPTYLQLVADGMPGGFAASDGAALHFQGTQLMQVVTSRPQAGAYRVEYRDGAALETRLAATYLG